jgi:2-C-methyl-D-erythritol 4-phosphate cytidylyltransferase
VVDGGSSVQESIWQGLQKIYASAPSPDESVVLVHDGVRPLINGELISACIQSVREFGSAVTVSPASETIITVGANGQVSRIADRSICRLARAPQCFFLSDFYAVHQKANQDGVRDMLDSASLMGHYNHPLHTVQGPVENIKITTPTDYYLFRAICEARENEQILGI